MKPKVKLLDFDFRGGWFGIGRTMLLTLVAWAAISLTIVEFSRFIN